MIDKKVSLKSFESSYQLNYVDSIENKPGNYNKYLKKVIKNLSSFDCIDFYPHIEIRSLILPNTDKKFSIFLDLDETLIHSDFDSELDEKNNKVLKFTHENEKITFNLNIRPWIYEFLSYAKENFEIIIFTASIKEYADCVLNYLDPENNIFKYRLYRESCIPILNKIFVKDLRIIKNRLLEKMIIIDNSFYSFLNQINNGILITSFYNDKNDNELLNLKKYLQYICDSNVNDLRIVNEKVFNFQGIKNEMLDC